MMGISGNVRRGNIIIDNSVREILVSQNGSTDSVEQFVKYWCQLLLKVGYNSSLNQFDLGLVCEELVNYCFHLDAGYESFQVVYIVFI